MATTVGTSTLTVTLTEAISLAGKDQGATTTKTISSIKSIFKRLVSVGATEVTLYDTHASTVAGSTFDFDNVKYTRITNKDGTNYVDLIIENSGSDEVGLRLEAGASYLFYDHSSVLDAIAGGVTVVAGVVATADQTVTDGDAASGMTEKQSVTLISTDGTKRKYVIVDSQLTTVANGDVLTSASDTGASTAGTALAGGIAVAINLTGSAETQNQYLVQLKAAIEHANGHNGRITVSAVPGEANGNQTITLTQNVGGADGNTTTTEDVDNFTSADFTSGVDGAISNLVHISSIKAIAQSTTNFVDTEIFIASV